MNRKTRKNKKQDNKNPTQLYFHLLLQLPLQNGNSCTAVSCTNQTTTEESGQCLSACYSLIFWVIHVDVILTCSIHLIDAANQAHTPKSMTPTNNLHQQCTTTHTSKRSTILQPTGPKYPLLDTKGHLKRMSGNMLTGAQQPDPNPYKYDHWDLKKILFFMFHFKCCCS